MLSPTKTVSQMKTKVQFISSRNYAVTNVMIQAAMVEADVYDAVVTEEQVRILLDLGLPHSIEAFPVATAAAQIEALAASRMLEAAVTAKISSRPWVAKIWQTLLCTVGRHATVTALAHPDRAAANAARCELYECQYCEHIFVHEFGRGTFDFSLNTRMAEHRDRVKRIQAAHVALSTANTNDVDAQHFKAKAIG